MNKKDYVFEIKWNEYVVGLLAQLDKDFYLIMKDKKNVEEAVQVGFVGIPGFIPEKVYKSNELFDFFKNRVLTKEDIEACEELATTKGKSMVDSFFVDKLPEDKIEEYKKKILETHKIQEALRALRDKKEAGQEIAACG